MLPSNGGMIAARQRVNTVGVGVTLANDAGGWRIHANCRNCTDEVQVVSVLSDFAYVQGPRTWQVTFKYYFGARR